MAVATFAAGCFWGIEAAFRRVDAVTGTTVGYTGGHVPEPSYGMVCRGDTGHAEAVLVEYDPARISYEDLLDLFWTIHDPTQKDRQGPDVGHQYRSAIFYHDSEQAAAARTSKEAQTRAGKHRGEIVTEISPAGPFYRAEDYHQQYEEKRRGSVSALFGL